MVYGLFNALMKISAYYLILAFDELPSLLCVWGGGGGGGEGAQESPVQNCAQYVHFQLFRAGQRFRGLPWYGRHNQHVLHQQWSDRV